MGVELIRYKARYSSASTISRLYMESTPITNNADSNWSVTDHAMTIMNTAICIGDLAGNGQTKMCIALLSRTSDVVIENQYSNDGGTTWTRGSSFVYTYPYNNGSHTAYSGGGLAKFPNTDVIYSTNIDDVTEVYSIGTAVPVFTNISDYMNYIQNPAILNNTLLLGKRSTSYGIYWIVGDPWEQPKTGQEILNYISDQGCNVGFLYDDGTYTHGEHYQLFLFNAKLLNGDLYICIDIPSGSSNWFGVCKNGGSGVVSGQRNRVLRGYLPTTSFYDDAYQPNSWSNNLSYNNKIYAARKGSSNINKPTILFTTLNYNRLFINDREVTADTYDWESVRSVEGKGKTYKLTKYLNINNGDPVDNVSYVNNVDVSAKSKVNNMVDDVIVDGGKVTVRYTIPAGSYSYIKLVYKKNSIPASYSDGTAVDITQSSTSKVFDRLDFKDTAVYWFAIFTDKSTSEPVSLDLKGYNPVPAEYQDYIDLINGVQPFKYQYALTDNWVTTLTNENAKYNNISLADSPKNASYIQPETISISTWNQSAQRHLYIATKEGSSYNYDPVMCSRNAYSVEPFSVNITGSGNSYSYTISGLTPKPIWGVSGEYYWSGAPWWHQSESKWSYMAYFNPSSSTIPTKSFSGTLEQCLQMLAMQVRNVDLYVNGELWSRKVS